MRRFATAAVLAVTFACGLAWIQLGPTPDSDKPAAAIVLMLTLAAAATLVPASASPIHPGTLLLAIVSAFFVIAPQVQLAVGEFTPHHLQAGPTSFIDAGVATLLFLAAFAFGQSAGSKSRACAAVGNAGASLSVRQTRRVVLAYVVIGASGWAAYFAAMGGVSSFLSNIQNKTQLASGLGYLYFFASLLQVGAIVAAMAQAAKRPVLPTALVVVLCAVAFLLVLVSGSRSRAVMLLLILAIQGYALGWRPSVFRAAAFAVFGIAIIFAAGQVRSLGTGGDEILDSRAVVEAVRAGEATLSDRLTTDYGHFDRLSLVCELVPDHLPLQWGGTMASVLLVPIPRAWFPGKPVGSGPLLANTLRPGAWDLQSGWASGVTPTLPGELFLNFWWPGLVVGGFAFGAAFRRMHSRYIEDAQSPWDATKYALAGVLLLMAGVLGEFYGTIIAYAIYAVPAHVGAWYAEPRTAGPPR